VSFATIIPCVASQRVFIFAFVAVYFVIDSVRKLLDTLSYMHACMHAYIHTYIHTYVRKSRDSSVGLALGYGLDDRGSRFRFPAGTGNFSLHHRIQNGSGAHPASYPVRTKDSFPGGKAAGA
jgi:hypothetical protein